MNMQARYGLTDYIGKCATCRHFVKNKNPTIRDGKCKGIHRSRRCPTYSASCKGWELDPETICDCNLFKEAWYRFCPNCGKRIKKPGEALSSI